MEIRRLSFWQVWVHFKKGIMCKRYDFNKFMLCKQFFTIIIIHSHDDDESQVRSTKKYSLSFLFHIFLFLCWLWIFLFLFCPKKDECIKSRELNVLFFSTSRERSERREEKLILPKSGLCSSVSSCSTRILLPLAILDEYILSPPISRTLHAALSSFVVWLFCSTNKYYWVHILKFSNYNVCGFQRMSAAGAEADTPLQNICIVLWFYNSLLLKNI